VSPSGKAAGFEPAIPGSNPGTAALWRRGHVIRHGLFFVFSGVMWMKKCATCGVEKDINSRSIFEIRLRISVGERAGNVNPPSKNVGTKKTKFSMRLD
jgi:hypothetical protein